MNVTHHLQKVLKKEQQKEQTITWLTLFTTTGTLVCCALPIIFVTLGLGATVAAMTSAFPILVTMSKYKIWVFAFSGFMLLLSGWSMYRPGRQCPTDKALGQACSRAYLWNKRIYWSSVFIWSIGAFAAFLALPLRIWLGV
ncbi:hypothetical protein [sulfur-oxidizing endosymbiont of Gigantopelta aegis]|uniref:hypothetical protein n=1 Tax=sulfur-oxidizing endosymbiont of Gigantopelta aegis TaxID=2794934 RepID=UPI0018DE4ABD|nr:hypothetical protein [sulfur-oxidizing endosymbiont of Gigantopelta aegis]